ncbi:nucleotidyltransferase [Candidatus Falkowbacteria bacterium CG_4_9_14_3_um_filter_38_19]|uniref:Nucleotidyltransferase n=2 Tax=Candidatus Falkowiibacteriota TaxID=1752728 RepID=A0A2M6WPK3_9BACT|nr:nucleotidyltransferase domain-containing protein [Candidatus Kuenenbacteria bacterium]PIT94702.1 MAG: nucleotidyltransferase [Candidatus Falkowbacteria bacterium CG10_big_fil_rev_8_21_14_0_10_38_22]PJB15538.1 MAG: nucleotidyltransferase [Candidatus Falkowbacteria bacterium CG_4_9_14_3_um_filter_38_19]
MAKKRIPKQVEKKIKEYVDILKADNLPIKKVILYGSYAKGRQHKWSDIDVCIISPKFKDPFKALQYLSLKTIFDMKYTIEPVGFSPRAFQDKYDSFIYEIKTTGIEISV